MTHAYMLASIHVYTLTCICVHAYMLTWLHAYMLYLHQSGGTPSLRLKLQRPYEDESRSKEFVTHA